MDGATKSGVIDGMRGHERGAALRRAALVAGPIVLLGAGLWIVFAQWRDPIFDENRIVEDLTVAVYLLAFAIGLIAAIRLRGRYKAPSLAVIPVIALLFALEEIDWGFLVVYGTDNGDKPELLGKFGIDLHDLPDAFSYAVAHGLLPPLDWIAAIALVFAVALIGAHAAILWCRRDALRSEPAMALLALTLALVSLAKLLDAVKDPLWSAIGFDPTPIEESAELAAAVALFLAASGLRQSVAREAHRPVPAPVRGEGSPRRRFVIGPRFRSAMEVGSGHHRAVPEIEKLLRVDGYPLENEVVPPESRAASIQR